MSTSTSSLPDPHPLPPPDHRSLTLHTSDPHPPSNPHSFFTRAVMAAGLTSARTAIRPNAIPPLRAAAQPHRHADENEELDPSEDEQGADEDEDDQEGSEDEDEDEDDVDAQAEAMAKSLGDQLLAEIGRAFAVPGPAVPATSDNARDETGAAGPLQTQDPIDPLVSAISVVLQYAASDPQLFDILQHTAVPGSGSILDCLKHVAVTGQVQEDQAEMLSNVIAAIANGSLVAAPSDASTPIPGPSRKRKRGTDEADEGWTERRRGPKSPIQELKAHLFATIAMISHALLLNAPPEDYQDDPMQVQSQQILSFAQACAQRAEADDIEVPEVTALVWMLRSLSGLPPPSEGGPWNLTTAFTPDGRALYPCLQPECHHSFDSLSSLQLHLEQHDQDRPYRCRRCPASFVRNHDLKRHYNLHEKKTFVCQGCNKTYTRRDALKRHKDHPKSAEACRTSEVAEVATNLDPADHAESESRVQRKALTDSINDQAQAVVSQLFSLLQTNPPPHPPPPPLDRAPSEAAAGPPEGQGSIPDAAAATLSNFGLSMEHTQLLQRAIAMTAEAARQQAEREAEDEEGSGGESDDEEPESEDGDGGAGDGA